MKEKLFIGRKRYNNWVNYLILLLGIEIIGMGGMARWEWGRLGLCRLGLGGMFDLYILFLLFSLLLLIIWFTDTK